MPMRLMSKILITMLAVQCVVGAIACARRGPSNVDADVAASAERFGVGQIIDTTTGRSVSIDQVVERVEQQEVLYLGEEHHNRFHIEYALALINRLLSKSRQPIIAMEMFAWDNQALLNRYLMGDDLNRQEFLEQVGWPKNWGGPFEDYEPLVALAMTERLRLAAMNPPKAIIRSVARMGLEQARKDPDWSRWRLQGETIVDDPLYREKIIRQLRACHDGGPDEMYQAMYEASMVRDEGMAITVVSLVEEVRTERNTRAGPVVTYTGGGHIQFNLPVPKRVARRLSGQVRQVSIYMTTFEEGRLKDIQEMIQGKIADYVWLTPLGAHGAPRRC